MWKTDHDIQSEPSPYCCHGINIYYVKVVHGLRKEEMEEMKSPEQKLDLKATEHFLDVQEHQWIATRQYDKHFMIATNKRIKGQITFDLNCHKLSCILLSEKM